MTEKEAESIDDVDTAMDSEIEHVSLNKTPVQPKYVTADDSDASSDEYTESDSNSDDDDEESTGQPAIHLGKLQGMCNFRGKHAMYNSTRVTMCGIDPSSMVHRLYTVGASTFSEPPKKMGKSRPFSGEDPQHTPFPPHSSDVPMCGLNHTASNNNSAIQRFLAASADTLANPQQLCHRKASSSASKDLPQADKHKKQNHYQYSRGLQFLQSKKSFEQRVISIAKDLKGVAPELVKRENIIKLVKRTERKQKNGNRHGRKDSKSERKKKQGQKSSLETGSNALSTILGDDSDHSSMEGYPSDIDEFLDYAKHVVDEQNTSYDEGSFRDFESVLQESIRTHFLDGDDDDDSMTSASTFSGYDQESKNNKKHLEENSLITLSSFSRVQNKIARPKIKKMSKDSNGSETERNKSNEEQIELDALLAPRFLELNKELNSLLRPPDQTISTLDDHDDDEDDDNDASTEVNDPIAPLVLLSDDDRDTHNNTKDDGNNLTVNSDDDHEYDDTLTSAFSWTDAIKKAKVQLMPMKGAAEWKSRERVSASRNHSRHTTDASTGSKTQISCNDSSKSDNVTSGICTAFGSIPIPAIVADLLLIPDNSQKTSSPTAAESDSDDTVTTGTSWTAISQQAKIGNTDVLNKYAIDFEDNSVVSLTPYDSQRRIRKRRFRRKRVDSIAEELLLEDDDDASAVEYIESVEQRVDDLAHYLAGDVSRNTATPDTSLSIDKNSVLIKLRSMAPDLYKAVIERIQSQYPSKRALKQTEELPPLNSILVDETKKPTPPSGHGSQSSGSPPQPMRTSNPLICGTPDKVYWADNSLLVKEGDLDDSLVLASSASGRHQPPAVTTTSAVVARSPPGVPPNKHVADPSLSSAMSPFHSSQIEPSSETSSQVESNSRGRYWDETLNVTQEEISESVPEISVDDNGPSSIISAEKRKNASSFQPDGSYLDVMIERFLSMKFDRINSLMRERQIIAARKHDLHQELRTAHLSLRPVATTLLACMDNMDSSGSQEGETESVVKGRALIRKIQRKRKALLLVRQGQKESHRRDPTKQSVSRQPLSQLESNSSDNSQSTISILQLHSIAEITREGENSEKVEANTAASMTHNTIHSEENGPTDCTRHALLRVRARRRQQRKAQFGRFNPPPPKKALYESMDSIGDQDSEDTVQTGSTSAMLQSPQQQVGKLSFRRPPERNYEALAELDSSFDASTDMSSGEILEAFAPPSPESPIREYRLAEKAMTMAGLDKTDYVLREKGPILVLSDTEDSRKSLRVETTAGSDNSFTDIVLRSSSTKSDEHDVFVNIQKKASPTSISDFFKEYQPLKFGHESLSFVDYGEDDPLFLDDDDRYFDRPEMPNMTHDDSDEFDEATFISATQFEI